MNTLKEGKQRDQSGGYFSDPMRDDGGSGLRKSTCILHLFYIRCIAVPRFYS